MTAAMIFSGASLAAVAAAARPAVAKRYAALLSGPPMSKAIIRPRMTPSRTAEPLPLRPLSPSLRRVHEAAERLAEHDEHDDAGDQRGDQRDDHDRHQPARPGGHLPAGRSTAATTPARRPPMMPPRKPAPMRSAGDARRSTKPGAMPGRSAIA